MHFTGGAATSSKVTIRMEPTSLPIGIRSVEPFSIDSSHEHVLKPAPTTMSYTAANAVYVCGRALAVEVGAPVQMGPPPRRCQASKVITQVAEWVMPLLMLMGDASMCEWQHAVMTFADKDPL